MGSQLDALKECLSAISKEKSQEYLNKVSREQ